MTILSFCFAGRQHEQGGIRLLLEQLDQKGEKHEEWLLKYTRIRYFFRVFLPLRHWRDLTNTDRFFLKK